MISPIYAHLCGSVVGMILSKGIMVGINAAEQIQIVTIALLCDQDEEVRKAVTAVLDDDGDLVRNLWHAYVVAVGGHNREGVAVAEININDLLKKAREHADQG